MTGPVPPRLVRSLLKTFGLVAEDAGRILPSIAKVEHPNFRNTTELLAEARRLNYGGINDAPAKTLSDVFPNAQITESAPRPPRSIPSAVENVETAFKARATAREGAPAIGKSGIQFVDDIKTTDGGTMSTYRLPDGRTAYVRWSPAQGGKVAHVEYTGINPVGGPDFDMIMRSPKEDANTIGAAGVRDVVTDMKSRYGLDKIRGTRITGASAKAAGEKSLLLDPMTGQPYGGGRARIGEFAAIPLVGSMAKGIPGYQTPVRQEGASAPIATAENPRVGTDPTITPKGLLSMMPILENALLGQDIGEGLTQRLSPYVGQRLFGR